MTNIIAVSKGLATFGREVRLSIDEAAELEDADTADLFTEVSGALTNGCGLSKLIPRQRNKYAHTI